MRYEQSSGTVSCGGKLPFEEAQKKACQHFLLNTHFYGSQGATLYWLVG